MKFEVSFIESKPRWIEWLYLLIFGLVLLIIVPFFAMAMISEICTFIGVTILQFIKDKLDIDFTL